MDFGVLGFLRTWPPASPRDGYMQVMSGQAGGHHRGLGPSRPFIGVGIAGAITVTVPVSLLLLVLVSQAAAGEPPLSHHNIGEVTSGQRFGLHVVGLVSGLCGDQSLLWWWSSRVPGYQEGPQLIQAYTAVRNQCPHCNEWSSVCVHLRFTIYDLFISQ